MTKTIRLQKPHNHLKIWVVLALSAILLIGFGCGLKWDYQVSDALYNKPNSSEPAHIVYLYMIAAFCILAFTLCFAFIFSCYSYKKEKKHVPILGTMLGIFCICGFGIYLWFCMEPTLTYYGKMIGIINNAAVIFAALLISFLFTWFVIRKRADKLMCSLSFTYVLETLVVVALLVLIKDIWSRPSPLNAFTPNEHFYEPWWHIRPFYDWTVTETNIEFWTTPSGFGTQGAIVIFGFVQICNLTNKFDEKKLGDFFFWGGVSYAIILGIVRLMAGESYLTDVCISWMGGLWICYLTRFISGRIRENKHDHYAIILAAGSGKRMGIKTPKCFIDIDGQEMFQYSLATFMSIREIKNIILVVPKSKRKMFGKGSNSRIIVTTGGRNRNESFELAIKKINKIAHDNDQIIIHDAARPFIHREDIKAIIRSKENFGTLVTRGQKNEVDYRIGKYNVLTPQFTRFIYYKTHNNINPHGVDLISYLNLKPKDKNFIISKHPKDAKKITYKSDL